MTVRDLLSIIWSVISISVVVSLVWFLVESRAQGIKRSGQVALALILLFGGSLVSQTYMLLVLQYAAGAGDHLTPFFPLAVIAGGAIFIGGAWAAWLFRPRQVPTVLFLITVVSTATALTLVRWLLL